MSVGNPVEEIIEAAYVKLGSMTHDEDAACFLRLADALRDEAEGTESDHLRKALQHIADRLDDVDWAVRLLSIDVAGMLDVLRDLRD